MDFKAKNIARDNDEHFIIKLSIYQDDIIITDVCAPSNTTSKQN